MDEETGRQRGESYSVRSESRQHGLKALLLLPPGCGGRPWLTGPLASPRPWLMSLFLQGMTTVRFGCCALALWLCLQWYMLT